MKTILLLPLVLTLPAFAGYSPKEVVAPAQAPCLFTWFAGGSVGYLTEFEEPMYNIHVGTDTCWNVMGWNVALFAELGYAEKDGHWSYDREDNHIAYTLSDSMYNGYSHPSFDLSIMPITLNVKLERNLTGNLNAYFGGGLGVARVDLDVDTGYGKFSDDDWVFTAQIFAGLNYNVSQNFEIYGGARWIYLDDAKMSGGTFDLDDDFLFELGGRYNF